MIALIIVALVVVAAVVGWYVYNHQQRRGKVLISTPPDKPSPTQSATETNEEGPPWPNL